MNQVQKEEMIRLFIALLLPGEAKKRLGELLADLKPRGRGIKWVVPKNLHLTLKFVGDHPQKDVDIITDRLSSAVVGQERFAVTFNKCGGFPDLRSPRVLWVGLDGTQPAVEMAEKIDRALAVLGIAPEKRPFSPHLTLGRVKTPDRLATLTDYMSTISLDWPAITLEKVALVKSTLTSDGPIYENLRQFELKNPENRKK